MFAVPHTPVVLAGPLLQSAAEQQPPVGMHNVVPGQLVNPVLQAIAHFPPLQLAVPFADGTGQEMHVVPQAVALASGWQKPLQLWVPVGHTPEQAFPLGMHAPLQTVVPLGQAGTHARPLQVTVPPPVGAWHAVHEAESFGPQVARALLSTHLPPQT